MEVLPEQRPHPKNDGDDLTESIIARMVNISKLLRVDNATMWDADLVNFIKAAVRLSLN